MSKGTCTVPECDRPVRYKALCNAHYLRKMRHGDPLGSGRKPRLTRERFESKVILAESGCWEWSGAHFQATGYAIFNLPSESDGRWRPRTAHRVSYELFVGSIPDGLVIDHLCHNRGCVNPAHLEAVTQQVNVLRGEAPSATSARTNICLKGHELTPENTYTKPGTNRRQCRICLRAYWRAKPTKP